MSDRVTAATKVIAAAFDDPDHATEITFRELAQALDNAGLLAPEMQVEWGVEYTGVNHGNRHTQWYYREDSEPDSEAQALFEYRLFKKKGMNPRLVHRHVTAGDRDE